MLNNRIGVIYEVERLLEEGPEPLFDLGVECVQLKVWDIKYSTAENAAKIKEMLGDRVDVSSVWGGWSGPQLWNFTDGPLTLGIVPLQYRKERIKDLMAHADFAVELGAPYLATHMGFMPEQPCYPEYKGVVDTVKTIADYCNEKGIGLNFETGQETPVTLMRVFQDTGCDNLGINLDPANLILYGRGNPVDAVGIFGDKVKGVHVKDAEYPKGNFNELGEEKVVGEGMVNFPVFLQKLSEVGYDGDLYVEREITGDQQIADIKKTISYLQNIMIKMKVKKGGIRIMKKMRKMRKMRKMLSLFIVVAMMASLFVVVPAFAADGDLVAAVNAATTADEVKAALKTAIEGGTVVDANYKKVEDDKFDDVLSTLIGKNFADDAAVVTAFNEAVVENYNPAIAEIYDLDDPIKGEFANRLLTNGTYETGTFEGYEGTYFKATSGLSQIELENVIAGDKILDVYIDAYTEVWGKNDISTATTSRYDSHGLFISKASRNTNSSNSIKPYMIIGNSKAHTNKKNVISQPDAGNSISTIVNPSWHAEELELVFEGGLPVSQSLKIDGSAVQWSTGKEDSTDTDGNGTADLVDALTADPTKYPYGLASGSSKKLENLKYVIYNCNSNWSDDYSKSYVKDFNITLYKSLAEAIATTDVTDSALSNAFAFYKAKGVADIDACYEGTDCTQEQAYAYLREYVAENPSATASQIEGALTAYAMDLADYRVEIELCNDEGVKVYNYSAGDTLVANLSFKNNTDEERNIAFIAAVYDENGVLVKVSMPTDPVIAQGGRQTTPASFKPELPEDVDGTYMRLYVIDSSTISPYCMFKEYTARTAAQKALDGKKIIFIGNSFTYYGKTVIDAGQKVEEANVRKRFDDKGYFYQMCQQNGANVTVTNWTWGAHCLNDTFGGSCEADRGHDGHDHLADLKNMSDLKYDYVVIQPGSSDSAETIRTDIPKIQRIFKEANPEVKFIYSVHTAYYLSTSDKYKDLRECIYDVAREYGLIVVNWGELVADLIDGKAVVENATQAYNKNTFIISQSASDGYHPNMLTGYITTQMIYSAITGEKALGEDYSFCTDATIHSGFSIGSFLNSFYKYDNISPEGSEVKLVGDELTTFPEVFASESDMRGLQQLIDIRQIKD